MLYYQEFWQKIIQTIFFIVKEIPSTDILPNYFLWDYLTFNQDAIIKMFIAISMLKYFHISIILFYHMIFHVTFQVRCHWCGAVTKFPGDNEV